jgi:hypothetical protein
MAILSTMGEMRHLSNTNQDNLTIERTYLIRGVYRSLLLNDRTYAAFEPKQIIPLVEKLANRKIILDPMSGYGSLITFCSQSRKNVSAYCIEYNPPAYLWQVLINPINSKTLIAFAERIQEEQRKWPQHSVRGLASADWFPSESLRILFELLELFLDVADSFSFKGKHRTEIPLAILMPFVGRLAAWVQGNVVTHVKKGGLCIYEGWQDDFSAYLSFLRKKLIKIFNNSNSLNHKSILKDCMNIRLPSDTFSSMITSPPYPNSRDYAAMFGPENEFLAILEARGIIKGYTMSSRLIGCPRVSESDGSQKKTPNDVKSPSALAFLNTLVNFKGPKDTMYDETVYYLPSLSKYFYEIETAYENISTSLSRSFEGYIVVVNNTHRKRIIPVAQSVVETWRRLGFRAEIEDEFTRERPHVGGINPKVKGISARHIEYIIKVVRE